MESVSQSESQAQTTDCFVHLDIEVEHLEDDGTCVASGFLHAFFTSLSSNKDKLVSVDELVKFEGYKILPSASSEKAIHLEQTNEEHRYFPLGVDGSNDRGFFQGMTCKEHGVQSITFYPEISLMHKTLFFRHAQISCQHQGPINFSPLDRLAVRLELLCCQKNGKIRFVASPFESLFNGWPLLLPGVASLLQKPVQHRITPKMSHEWQCGPSPELVHGVDFSLAFSSSPVFLIPIQRQSYFFKNHILRPVFLLGIVLSIVGLTYSSEGWDSNVSFLASAIALLCLILLRLFAWGPSRYRSRFLDMYFLASLLSFVGILIVLRVAGSESVRDGICTLFLIIWIIFHFVTQKLLDRDIFRGNWEQIVSNAKRASTLKPEQFHSLQHSPKNLAKVVPVITQHALDNHFQSPTSTQEGYQLKNYDAKEEHAMEISKSILKK